MAGQLIKGGKSAIKLGRITPQTSSLFICDMQEKFRKNVGHFDEIVTNIQSIMAASQLMNVPMFVTEQYPKGLGKTVKELEIEEKYGLKPFEKTCFSMVLPELISAVKEKNSETKNILLCGIETHACIYHTAMDLLEKGM